MTCLHSVSLQISQEQIEAVLKLSGSERLRYFIKMIAVQLTSGIDTSRVR